MRNTKMNFGENLQKLRKEKNISQEQLAEELHVSRQTIGKWENSVTYPETECLIQISEFFEVSIDILLKGTVTDSSAMESASNRKADEEASPQAEQQLKSSAGTAQRNRRIRTVVAIILFIISPFYPGEPGANTIDAFLMILSIAVGIGLLIYNHMAKDQAG